jgi:hypothetical protein
MKTNRTQPMALLCLALRSLLFSILFVSVPTLALASGGDDDDDDDDDRPQELVFRNAVLESGTAGADGAIYRFAQVSSNLDALIKITKRSDSLVGLVSIDLQGMGWEKAFQPQVTYNNNTTPAGISNWWMEFEISFVRRGTSTPAELSAIDLTGLDIDGNNHLISESVTFFGSESYTVESSSLLQINNIFDPLTGRQGTTFSGPVLNFTSIDTSGTAVMTTHAYKSVQTISVRAGAHSIGASGASDRLYSFWFRSFRYSSAVLPIELSDFTASFQKNKVELKWFLPAKENASHFTIERSANGRNFEEIGMILTDDASKSGGKGYAFNENVSEKINGVLYYRLKIVDLFGQHTYSPTRIIKTGNTENVTVAAYPNPVLNELRVTVPSAWQNKSVRFELYNNSGQMVKQMATARSSQTESINMRDMQNGFYVMKVISGNDVAVQRIVKSNHN